MHKLRALQLLLLLGYAACDVAKSVEPKSAAPTSVSSTILTKSSDSKETKSRTEKRDSSDQTASYAAKPKDEPFRPMYHIQQQYYQPEAAVGGEGATRYAAVEAAGAAATPQAYYDKSELTGGIHYAAPAATATSAASAAHNAPSANTAGGVLYASSAYRGPFNPAYQQQQQLQQQQQHQNTAAAQQQVKTATANVAIAPQSPHTYDYAEPEASYIYERTPQYQQHQQHQQQQQQSPQQHHHHQQQQHSQQRQAQTHNRHQQQQQQQRPVYHREPQQIQYVIAIPLSYMRQLQHQLSAIPAHASQSYAQPSSLQVIGPLARDHQGLYRPYHYTASAGTAAAPPPSSADAVTSAAQAPPYAMQFIQLPASVILAAAKSLYQQPPPAYQQQLQQHQHHHHHQQQQQQLYYTPQHILQPAYHQHHPQQHHHHQLQQQQPVQQLAPLYAYPVQQQHQPQLQQQQQKQQLQQQQQQLHTVVRIGGVKPNPSAKLSQHQQHQHHPQAAPPQSVVAVPSHQPLMPPLLHYNSIYVQPSSEPPSSHVEPQALPGGAYSFARYSQSLLHEGAAAPPHFVQLSAPNALVAPQPHYSTLYSYEAEMAAPAYANEAPLPSLPYFTHPGAVHYGSHLYHPPTPTSAKVAAQSVATPHAAGNQAQPRAASSSGQHSSAVAAGDNTVVKYP